MTFQTPLPPTPTLETERLVLRPLALTDAPAIQRRFPKWEIVRHMHARTPWPYPDDGAEAFVRYSLAERDRGVKFVWAITLKGRADDEMIGGIDLWPFDGETQDTRGFWIDVEFWGQGLMTEAADRVTDYAFDDLGWPLLYLTNAADNAGSRRIKEKQGAELVATVPGQFVEGDALKDVWRLTAEAWRARRGG